MCHPPFTFPSMPSHLPIDVWLRHHEHLDGRAHDLPLGLTIGLHHRQAQRGRPLHRMVLQGYQLQAGGVRKGEGKGGLGDRDDIGGQYHTGVRHTNSDCHAMGWSTAPRGSSGLSAASRSGEGGIRERTCSVKGYDKGEVDARSGLGMGLLPTHTRLCSRLTHSILTVTILSLTLTHLSASCQPVLDLPGGVKHLLHCVSGDLRA